MSRESALFPVLYVHVVVTLPAELRAFVRTYAASTHYLGCTFGALAPNGGLRGLACPSRVVRVRRSRRIWSMTEA